MKRSRQAQTCECCFRFPCFYESDIPLFAAARKEDEEIKAQKSRTQIKTVQQQQQDDKGQPASSSTQPKANSATSTAGSISLAARSHQGIAEKAKEVVHAMPLPKAILFLCFGHCCSVTPNVHDCHSACMMLHCLRPVLANSMARDAANTKLCSPHSA